MYPVSRERKEWLRMLATREARGGQGIRSELVGYLCRKCGLDEKMIEQITRGRNIASKELDKYAMRFLGFSEPNAVRGCFTCEWVGLEKQTHKDEAGCIVCPWCGDTTKFLDTSESL